MYADSINRLKDKGYKLTPQRMTIIKVLHELADEHPSMNGIYAQVKSKLPTISFSTIFNTISTLEEIGVVKTFDFNDETRIEMNKKAHINIIDNTTNQIYDIEDKDLIEILAKRVNINKKKYQSMLVNIILD